MPKSKSKYVEYLDNEWGIQGWMKEGKDSQALIYSDLKRLLEAFSMTAHDEKSDLYTINMFYKLAQFQPISPLTGESEEWEFMDGDSGNSKYPILYRNKRYVSIFKETSWNINEFEAYNTKGRLFTDIDGNFYASEYSVVSIEKFPYMPFTQLVNYEESEKIHQLKERDPVKGTIFLQ